MVDARSVASMRCVERSTFGAFTLCISDGAHAQK